MSTRRTRIKLAPNLGVTRNKARLSLPVKPQIVIKSDTENSESEDQEDQVTTAVTRETPEDVANHHEDPPVNGCGDQRELPKNGVLPENGVDYPVVEITPMDLDSLPKEILNGNVETEKKDRDKSSCERMRPTGVGTKARLPMMRNKFRPNLNIDRGQRTPLQNSRPRTVSSSSTNSESDLPARQPPDSPILRSAILTPRPARVRRTTESRSTLGERTQFHNRRQLHKAKFSKGVPDRNSLTMFDLIYYNPQHGQRMSVEDEEDVEKVDDPDEPPYEGEQLPEKVEKTDLVTKEEEEVVERSDALPVPRVKVGVNGEIIIDEASLHVETTQQKEAKVILKAAPLVFENNKTSYTYGRWSRKRRHRDWTEKETVKFYKALSVVGSDFSMMESIFTNRTRSELRLKFKKEERSNSKLVDKCLNEKRMFTDLDSLINASEDEVEVVESQPTRKSRRSKTRAGRPRRRYKNRGLFDSSSEGEEGDIETSKSPVGKRPRTTSPDLASPGSVVQRVKRPLVVNGRKLPEEAGPAPEVPQLPDLTGVQFPPGLLAANPSLAGAKPGSLVVVAGPQKAQETRSPLHLYMVQVKEKEGKESPVLTSRAVSFTETNAVTELRLDPAVVRAVDRAKLHRQRTLSECDGESPGRTRRARQRTCSESGLADSTAGQTESLRTRFLSGNDG